MREEFLAKLKEQGAEVEDTLKRYSGDKEWYMKLLRMLVDNENIKDLRVAIDKEDYETAEREVHTLKGVGLNLGLLPLVDVCMDLLMDLRDGETGSAREELEAIEENFNQWVDLITKEE